VPDLCSESPYTSCKWQQNAVNNAACFPIVTIHSSSTRRHSKEGENGKEIQTTEEKRKAKTPKRGTSKSEHKQKITKKVHVKTKVLGGADVTYFPVDVPIYKH
jgi:hypothetical protein